jgi:hypothetical protein
VTSRGPRVSRQNHPFSGSLRAQHEHRVVELVGPLARLEERRLADRRSADRKRVLIVPLTHPHGANVPGRSVDSEGLYQHASGPEIVLQLRAQRRRASGLRGDSIRDQRRRDSLESPLLRRERASLRYHLRQGRLRQMPAAEAHSGRRMKSESRLGVELAGDRSTFLPTRAEV